MAAAAIPPSLYEALIAAADCATLAPGLCRLVYTAAGHPVANPRALTRPDCEGLAWNMQGQEPFARDRFFVVAGDDVRELDRATLSFARVRPASLEPGSRHRLSPLSA